MPDDDRSKSLSPPFRRVLRWPELSNTLHLNDVPPRDFCVHGARIRAYVDSEWILAELMEDYNCFSLERSEVGDLPDSDQASLAVIEGGLPRHPLSGSRMVVRDPGARMTVWRKDQIDASFFDDRPLVNIFDHLGLASATIYGPRGDPDYGIPRVHFGKLVAPILGRAGLLTVHAAMVESPSSGGGVLIRGFECSGKTTLCTYLMDAGCNFLSDEMIWIDPGSLTCYGYPRRLALSDDSIRRFFPHMAGLPKKRHFSTISAKSKWLVTPDDAWPGRVRAKCSLRHLVEPVIWRSDRARIKPLDRVQLGQILENLCGHRTVDQEDLLDKMTACRVFMGRGRKKNLQVVRDYLRSYLM